MISVFSAFAEVHAALRLPKNHVVLYLAKVFSLEVQEAQQRWAFVKKKMRQSSGSGDLFGALSLFEKMAHIPLKGEPNVRHVEPPRSGSHMSTHPQVRTTEVTSKIHVFKRPKIRRKKMDIKNIRRRMEYRVHRPSSSERAHRKLVRRLWMKRNAAALHRRREFITRYWRQHSGLRGHNR